MTESSAPPGFTLPAALVFQGFSLRTEADADIPFLMEQKQMFLASQFQAQRHHYRTFYSTTAFDVLERNGAPCGRLYLQRRQTTLHIIDIALLPASRGQGTGTAILEAVKAHARASGVGVTHMVEKHNPALRLYRRLGFTEIADHGVYLEMEWLPDRAQLNVA
jgi:ribosomal protein S18 acetylase RimI-like enzyme